MLPYYYEEELMRDFILGFPEARNYQNMKEDLDVAAGIAQEPGRLILFLLPHLSFFSYSSNSSYFIDI